MGAWIDGTLPPSDRGGVSSHLADCDACRQLTALSRLASESPCPDENHLGAWIERTLPSGEAKSVSAHLADCDDCRHAAALSKLTARPKPPIVWWGAAAAAAAAILLAIFIGGGSREPELPTPVVKDEPDPEPKKIVREDPKPEPKPEPEKPIVKEDPGPEPKPEPEPEPEKPIVKEDPKPEPKPEPRPEPEKPIVKEEPKKEPGKTVTNLDGLYHRVAMLDPSGHLATDDKAVGKARYIGWNSRVRADKDASFSVDGRMTVGLEKTSEVSFARPKKGGNYELTLHAGTVFLQSEFESVLWTIKHDTSSIQLARIRGAVTIDTDKGRLRVHVIEGEVVLGEDEIEEGREILVVDGKPRVKRASRGLISRKLKWWNRNRPELMTLFRTDFDEVPESLFFTYKVASGRIIDTRNGKSMVGGDTSGSKWLLSAELKASRPITARSKAVLRFRCRSNVSSLQAALGEWKTSFTGSQQWKTVEIPLSSFLNEGVNMISGDRFDTLKFGVPASSGALEPSFEIDSVELLKRK